MDTTGLPTDEGQRGNEGQNEGKCPKGKGAIAYIGGDALCPLPQPVRILLGEKASKALLESGECFMIGGKTSHPELPGRIVIHLVPIPKEQADAACLVALGTHRAVRIS